MQVTFTINLAVVATAFIISGLGAIACFGFMAFARFYERVRTQAYKQGYSAALDDVDALTAQQAQQAETVRRLPLMTPAVYPTAVARSPKAKRKAARVSDSDKAVDDVLWDLMMQEAAAAEATVTSHTPADFVQTMVTPTLKRGQVHN